jgi:hypothetical protein
MEKCVKLVLRVVATKEVKVVETIALPADNQRNVVDRWILESKSMKATETQGSFACPLRFDAMKKKWSFSALCRIASCRRLLLAIFTAPLFISTPVNAEVTLTHVSNSDCSTPCSNVAVIFVHGLAGSQDTWVNKTTGQSFPNLLTEDLTLRDKIDVYTIQYDSLWISGEPVVEVKKALEIPLDELMEKMLYSKVVFVAHRVTST